MPATCFIAHNSATGALNGAFPTFQPTAATVAIRTMLQIAPSTTSSIRIIEWGYETTILPPAPFSIQLIDTGAIFATMTTALTAAGVQPWNKPTGEASAIQLGASLSAFASAAVTEGTITATRLLDAKTESGLYYSKQWPLGREPEIAAGKCLRVQAQPGSAAAVSLHIWVAWEE
jgi:hypothetical protein